MVAMLRIISASPVMAGTMCNNMHIRFFIFFGALRFCSFHAPVPVLVHHKSTAADLSVTTALKENWGPMPGIGYAPVEQPRCTIPDPLSFCIMHTLCAGGKVSDS